MLPSLGAFVPEMGKKPRDGDALTPTALADALFTSVQQRVLGLLFGQGARRVLERMLERSFGPLTNKCGLALEAADVHDLNACFERLATAGSAEEVLDPILSKLLD